MRILITGATGLLGSAVARLAREAGHEVDGISHKTDLTRVEGVHALVSDNFVYDTVIHCAAKVAGVKTAKADPAAFVTENLVMSARLFEACAKAKPQPLLMFVSSSTVYPSSIPVGAGGNTGSLKIAVEGWPLDPHPIYQGVGGVKVYLESLLDFYEAKYNLRSCIVRPTAIYGPGDRSDHVIPDLIRRALGGEMPLKVWGDPTTIRDFVYVDDAARGVLRATLQPGCIVNLGSGTKTTIQELADTVIRAVYTDPYKLVELEDRYSGSLIRFDATQPNAIPVRQVSIERAEKILGWRPSVSLADGIKQTVAWFRQKALRAVDPNTH